MSTDLIRSIAESSNRAQLLVAAAGAGKTHVLTNVLAKRLETGLIDPETDSIVVFTFTNNAANELIVRLSRLLPNAQDALTKMYVGTIHGWCNDYLTSRGQLSNTKVIDELERTQLLLRIYQFLEIDGSYPEGNSKYAKVLRFVRDLELFHNEGLEISDVAIPNHIRKPLAKYLSFIDTQRLLDFGSLVSKAIASIRTMGKQQSRFCLYVDEYQDVNPAQVILFKELVHHHPKSNLLAVGDPRQAIYQWRGSDVGRILNFERDFPGAETFNLTMNRRSRPGILRFANAVARDLSIGSTGKIPDMTPDPERSDGEISVIADLVDPHHSRAVAAVTKKLIDNGVPPADIAVLMRSVLSDGTEVMKELEALGVEFFSPNRNSGTVFIEEFMGSVIRLIELMHEGNEPQNREEEQERGDEIQQGLRRIARFRGDGSTTGIHDAIAAWYESLLGIRTEKHGARRHGFRNEDYNFRRQLFDFCGQIGFTLPRDQPELQEGFAAVTQIMRAIEEAYRRRFKSADNSRPPSILVFLKNLKWQLKDQIERWTETGMTLRRDDCVTVSTVHAAKGLEWPVVLVPFLWKRKFPVRKSAHGTSFPASIAGRYATTVEDERRLWYVAITRARDRLYFFSGSDANHKSSPFSLADQLGMIEGTTKGDDPTKPLQCLSSVIPLTREHFYHVGVSDFLLLVDCPYQFHLRKICNVQVPVGEELGAGNIVHRVIERLSKGEQHSTLSDIVQEEVYLPLGELSHEKRVMKSIVSKVERLVETGLLDHVDLAEYGFTIPIEDLVVSGVVDATIKDVSGVSIVDWKSSIHKEFRQRYENQLVLYAYALTLLGVAVKDGIIYDLSSESSEVARILVDVGPREQSKMLKSAERAIGDLKGSPVKTWPAEITCSACDLRDVCPDAIKTSSHSSARG